MKVSGRLLSLISFIVGGVSALLGKRFIGEGFGSLIGLACGLGLLAVVYWLNFMLEQRKADKQKT